MLMLNTTTRLMKSPSLILAIAGLALGSAAAVAQSVTTDPVGFTTLTIKGNAVNLVGLNMVKPVTYQGVVSGVSGATVTDANANFDTALTAGKKYFVEIISGDYAGLNAEILSWSGSSITIAGDVGGIAAALDGAGHRIRESWTLAGVFGAENQAGLGGGTAATADFVYVSGPEGLNTYYYKTSGPGGTGWRQFGGSLSDSQAEVALYFTDALIVERRQPGDLAVKLVGAVKTGRTIVPVLAGINVISNVYPVTDITLENSGLYGEEGFRLTGGTAATADLVFVPGAEAFLSYYYKTSGPGGIGWRRPGDSSTDYGTTGIPIGSGIVVQRGASATPTNVILSPTF